MVLTEGEKSIVEILWLVAWYAYDIFRHVYILFNSEFLWTQWKGWAWSVHIKLQKYNMGHILNSNTVVVLFIMHNID